MPAREAVVAAEAARAAASEEARKTTRDLEPMSVFISRNTQHLYVRQGFQPILDIPVTIRDPDRPIGTHVYTATEQTCGDRNMRWSVVSFVSGQSDAGLRDAYESMRGDSRGNVEPLSGDLDGGQVSARPSLIPKETLDRIAETISPRSSLIISDEPLSSETGQGTEFVVLLSGEPQGGIKNRRRGPDEARHRRPGASRSELKVRCSVFYLVSRVCLWRGNVLPANRLRRPEQERRGVQAVDAGLNVADVPAFLGLASQRNEPQGRIGIAARLRAPVSASSFALPSS